MMKELGIAGISKVTRLTQTHYQALVHQKLQGKTSEELKEFLKKIHNIQYPNRIKVDIKPKIMKEGKCSHCGRPILVEANENGENKDYICRRCYEATLPRSWADWRDD